MIKFSRVTVTLAWESIDNKNSRPDYYEIAIQPIIIPPQNVSHDIYHEKYEVELILWQFVSYNVSLTAINCNGKTTAYLEIG